MKCSSWLLLLCMLSVTSCQTRATVAGSGTDPHPASSAPDTLETIKQSMTQGYDDYQQGDMQGAAREWEISLALSRKVDRDRLVAVNLSNLGLALLRMGRFARALDCFREARGLCEKQGNRKGERDSLRRIGATHYSLGDFQQAGDAFAEASVLDTKLGDSEGELIERTHLANVQWHLGRYADALEAYSTLEDQAGFLGNPKRQADALVGKGLIHEELGRAPEAISCYEKAVALYRELGLSTTDEAVALNNLAFVRSSNGQHTEALETYKKALAAFVENNDARGEATVLSNMGQVQAAFGKYPQALDLLHRALRTHEQIGDKQGQALDLLRLGSVYQAMGSPSFADEKYRAALVLAEKTGRPDTIARTHFLLGRLQESRGDDQAALANYREAMNTVEGMVAQLESREDRQGFLGSKVQMYDALIQLLFKLHRRQPSAGYESEALVCCEKLRGLKRRERLNAVERPFHDLKRQAFFDKQRRIRAKSRRIEEQLALEKSRPGGEQDPQMIRELEYLRKTLKTDYKKFIDTLKEEDPSFLLWISVDPVKLGSIQKVLEPEEIILEYYVTERYVYIFAISSEGLFVEYVNVDAQVLDENVTNMRRLIQHAKPGSGPDTKMLREISAELYQILIGPVEELLAGKQVIGILPNKKLHYLPFQALVRNDAHGEPHFLVEDFAVFHLNTKGLLNLTRGGAVRPRGSGPAFIAFANADGSLPFTEEEVATAARDFDDARVFLRDEATEDRLESLAPKSRLVHLATHGRLDQHDPRNSFLQLHQGELNDGRLVLDEIYGLDLDQVDLVTLSACDTAIGRLAVGDELVALSEAFLFAGAPTVVATLWRVDDKSTALLMQNYYRHLQAGQDKLSSLREAQLDLMKSRGWDDRDDLPFDYSHPYYWAPFILVGEYR